MLEAYLGKIIPQYHLEPLTTQPTDGYYDHTTFAVRSLHEFITLTEAFALTDETTPYTNFLYRGMADQNWQLIPSLMRRLSEVSFGYGLEHELAVEFNSEMPFLFQNTDSSFGKIAKMQHFGIPTRLLDFTLNPLIALYFACAEQPRTPGRVVFTRGKLHHYDDRCVECTAALYLYDNCTNVKLDDWLHPYDLSVSDYLFRTYTSLFSSAPLFVKPLYLDERMRMQRSVFLLFHNYVRDSADRCYYGYDRYNRIDPAAFQHEDLDHIYAEQIAQPRIGLRDSPYFAVDKCSFDRLTDLYRQQGIPDFQKRIDAAFANRFSLQDDIEPLETADIRQEFSSVIIPPGDKKTILSQLAHIGIDEAYVYPEAEHIARRIRRQQQ